MFPNGGVTRKKKIGHTAHFLIYIFSFSLSYNDNGHAIVSRISSNDFTFRLMLLYIIKMIRVFLRTFAIRSDRWCLNDVVDVPAAAFCE